MAIRLSMFDIQCFFCPVAAGLDPAHLAGHRIKPATARVAATGMEGRIQVRVRKETTWTIRHRDSVRSQGARRRPINGKIWRRRATPDADGRSCPLRARGAWWRGMFIAVGPAMLRPYPDRISIPPRHRARMVHVIPLRTLSTPPHNKGQKKDRRCSRRHSFPL